MLPDTANLLPEGWTIDFSGRELSAQWVGWLCAQQLSLAGLCAWAAWGPRSRPVLVAGILWFIVQAVDELIAGNFFGAGLWEYPILVTLFAATLYITSDEGRTDIT